MNALHIESIGGASGDMILAALIDLGIDRQLLTAQLNRLDVEPFEIAVSDVNNSGLRGTQVRVNLVDKERNRNAPPHRNLGDIQRILAKSNLDEAVTAKSLKVFRRLAEAEARVHGTTPDKIHFHEVGAVDSIVDIVGACLAMSMLNCRYVSVAPLPLGVGSTKSAHGVIPIPVPATVELLKGQPVTWTDVPYEMVTPTGAALLSTFRNLDAPTETCVITAIGHGFGHRTLDSRPNLLRAFLLEIADAPAETGKCLVLESNLDDTSPELIGSLTKRLFDAGALDVFVTPVQMKKQRPGMLLTVLCRPKDKPAFLDLIFRESATFGVREYAAARTILDRRHEVVKTAYGKVHVKIGRWRGEDITHSPEYDDCVKCAAEHGIPARAVYEAALRAAGSGT